MGILFFANVFAGDSYSFWGSRQRGLLPLERYFGILATVDREKRIYKVRGAVKEGLTHTSTRDFDSSLIVLSIS